jgi:hypothetical protein
LEFDDEKYLSNSRHKIKQEDLRFNILYSDPRHYISPVDRSISANPTADNKVQNTIITSF